MTQVAMTSFGETSSSDAFFTGKPMIGELGYAFLFRNYRADNGKWQTADPTGYPDGFNNFAYCNNRTTKGIDFLGAWYFEATSDIYPDGYFSAPIFINDVFSVTVYGAIGASISDLNSLLCVDAYMNLNAATTAFDANGNPLEDGQYIGNAYCSAFASATINGNQITPETDNDHGSDSLSNSSISYYDPNLGIGNATFSLYTVVNILFMPSGTINSPYSGMVYASCCWYISCPLGTGCNVPEGSVMIPLGYAVKE